METWYKMSKIGGWHIEEVQILKHSEHFIWTEKGRKEARLTDWYSYHPTREGAKSRAVQMATNHLEYCKAALVSAERDLEKVKSL